jgi:hypothetical protein
MAFVGIGIVLSGSKNTVASISTRCYKKEDGSRTQRYMLFASEESRASIRL